MDGVAWVQQAGAISDQEDHHPDIHIFYRRVVLDLWTHTVNGLSENDYILAAKLDQSYNSFPGKR
jgi:4a-hydroxytetrahydrobiopterin dehydratase